MIGLLLAIIVDTSLISEKVTAAQLVADCTASDSRSVETCKAFIVSGATTLSDSTSGLRKICAPAEADFPAYRDVYMSYVRAHPDEGNSSAVLVILEAYESAFPCR